MPSRSAISWIGFMVACWAISQSVFGLALAAASFMCAVPELQLAWRRATLCRVLSTLVNRHAPLLRSSVSLMKHQAGGWAMSKWILVAVVIAGAVAGSAGAAAVPAYVTAAMADP